MHGKKINIDQHRIVFVRNENEKGKVNQLDVGNKKD